MTGILALVVFLLAVYGLANALAVLKIGCWLFGDPRDEIELRNGQRIPWKSVADRVDKYQFEDLDGRTAFINKTEVARVRRRRGLGRIPYVGDLFYCPACLSFWIGMAASNWVLSPATLVCAAGWRTVLLDGLAASAASWLLHVAAMRLAHGVEDA